MEHGRRIVEELERKYPRHFRVEVDGGIGLSNVREVLNAGANVIVAGSAVFGDRTAENTREFMEILREYE